MIFKGLSIGAGVLAMLFLSWALLSRGSMLRAEGRAATAEAKEDTCRVALETQTISTKEATAAVEQATAENAEKEKRCAAALEGGRAREENYRAQLSRCQSAEAVADRLGTIFP